MMKAEPGSQGCQIETQPIKNSNIYPNQTGDLKEMIQKSGEFIFQGDADNFTNIVKSLTTESINEITHCSVVIMGEEIKPGNAKCLILTVIMGLLCIFPLCFFCCQWWKRVVSQIFRMDESTYRQLAKLMEGSKLQSVQITVYDNFLTHKKMNILSKSLSRSSVVSLTFRNEAGAFDMLSQEYSNFLINAKSLTRLKMKQWEITWYRESVNHLSNTE